MNTHETPLRTMCRRSVDFLIEASLLYEDSCPGLSRFLMQRPRKATIQPRKMNGHLECRVTSLFSKASVCPHCCQWFRPGNHHVRIRPKRRPSARVQIVLHREARGKRLSLAQRELLRRFQKSPSKLMATCHSCNKTSRYNGVNRDFIAAHCKARSTPGSTGKHKTPQATSRPNMSTPKSGGKEKTPCNTPKSLSSNTPGSGSSSSKTPSKVKKWVVQRLSKILIREDNQGSKKGSLKDFLSSL
ncbi:UPF0711 protein C18orf21 homolog [Polymixia lowei]